MGAILNAIFPRLINCKYTGLLIPLMTVFFLIQSQEDSSIGPVVLDLVGTVQAYVMKATNSMSLNKPLVTKNIRKYGQTLK